MKQKKKNKLPKMPKLPHLPKLDFGGDFGDVIRNGALAYGDTTLTTLGLSNVIKDDDYKGKGSQFARGYSNIVGGVGKAVLPMAMNIVAPGSGALVGAGQQALGSLNPQAAIQYDEYGNPIQSKSSKIGGSLGNIAGAALPFAMNMMSNGGVQYAQGGINAEVEKQENSISPDGEFTQYDGPSHANGGIQTHLDNGEMVFSDKLKLGGKTFAKLNKPYNTNKEDKILEDSKSSTLQKATANLMKQAKLKQSMELFNQQEELKQSRLNKYANRLGISLPQSSNDNEYNEPSNQSEQSEGEMKYGGIHIKPENKGKFNALKKKTGKSTEELTHSKNPLTRKRAIFAQNAKKWHHEDGGIHQYPDGGKYPGYDPNTGGHLLSGNQQPLTAKDLLNEGYVAQGDQWYNSNTGKYYKPYNPNNPNFVPKIINNLDTDVRFIPSNNNTPNPIPTERKPIDFNNGIGAYNPNTGQYTKSTGYNEPIGKQIFNYKNGGIKKYPTGGYGPEDNLPVNLPQQNWALGTSPIMNDIMPLQGNTDINTTNIDNYMNPEVQSPGTNYSPYINAAKQLGIALGSNIGNFYDLNRSRKPEVEKFQRLNPTFLNNDATVANNNRIYKNTVDSLKGAVGGNSSAYIQSRIAASNNKMMNDALTKQQVDNANAGISNDIGAFNTQISNQEAIANSQNRAMSRNLAGSAYSNIGQNIMQQSRDNNLTNRDQDFINLITTRYPEMMNDPQIKQMMLKYQGK